MNRRRKILFGSITSVAALFTAQCIFLLCLPSVEVASFEDKEADVIEAVIRSFPNTDPSRDYYLTPTKFEDWAKSGDWDEFSSQFHKRIEDLPVPYKKASWVYMSNSGVRHRYTHGQTWVRWVYIEKWVSPNKVIVNSGVWTGDLGGGGGTSIWELNDGVWECNDVMSHWIS